MPLNQIEVKIKYCPECGYYRASSAEQAMPSIPTHPVQGGMYTPRMLNHCPFCKFERAAIVRLFEYTHTIRSIQQYTEEQIKNIEGHD